jgi:pentatricopeptide repeat protein
MQARAEGTGIISTHATRGCETKLCYFSGGAECSASVGALEEGRSVHVQIVQSGLESEVFVGSSLVDMYAKCGSIEDAWRVFNKMPSRDVVSWSAMILGHVKCGQSRRHCNCFDKCNRKVCSQTLLHLWGS